MHDYCPNGANPGDTAWMIVASVLVLGMMPGLALFEIGLLPSKYSVSVMLQVLSGLMILPTLWGMVGFSFVFGESLGGFIGNPGTFPFLMNVLEGGCLKPAPTIPSLVFAAFQTMFASITPLLMTGAFAGRLKWKAFWIFIVLWEILVYYPIAHWIWGLGWLSLKGPWHGNDGVLDFAGGIVIHTTAGTGALVSALMLGRRVGFEKQNGVFTASNLPFAIVGCTLLWMGWFGFNAGSSLTAGSLTALAVMNTQLAASISGLIWLALSWFHHRPSLIEGMNGVVAGLAGITPASGFVSVYSAAVIAVVLGLVSYYGVIVLKKKLKIDDALDVTVVHGITGIVGSLAIGFASSHDVNPVANNGLIFGHPAQLGYQIMGVGVAMGWSGFWTFVLLKILDLTVGIRVHADVEQKGLDEIEHGEAAYDYENKYRAPEEQLINGEVEF